MIHDKFPCMLCRTPMSKYNMTPHIETFSCLAKRKYHPELEYIQCYYCNNYCEIISYNDHLKTCKSFEIYGSLKMSHLCTYCLNFYATKQAKDKHQNVCKNNPTNNNECVNKCLIKDILKQKIYDNKNVCKWCAFFNINYGENHTLDYDKLGIHVSGCINNVRFHIIAIIEEYMTLNDVCCGKNKDIILNNVNLYKRVKNISNNILNNDVDKNITLDENLTKAEILKKYINNILILNNNSSTNDKEAKKTKKTSVMNNTGSKNCDAMSSVKCKNHNVMNNPLLIGYNDFFDNNAKFLINNVTIEIIDLNNVHIPDHTTVNVNNFRLHPFINIDSYNLPKIQNIDSEGYNIVENMLSNFPMKITEYMFIYFEKNPVKINFTEKKATNDTMYSFMTYLYMNIISIHHANLNDLELLNVLIDSPVNSEDGYIFMKVSDKYT